MTIIKDSNAEAEELGRVGWARPLTLISSAI